MCRQFFLGNLHQFFRFEPFPGQYVQALINNFAQASRKMVWQRCRDNLFRVIAKFIVLVELIQATLIAKGRLFGGQLVTVAKGPHIRPLPTLAHSIPRKALAPDKP